MKLEYLIMYTDLGIPVYARCFAEICKNSIGNPTLFSAFLASLNQFAKIDPDALPEEMDLDGTPLKINFNPEDGVNYVQMEELQLMFLYSNLDDITIATGFNSEKYDREDVVPVFRDFLKDVEGFLKEYEGTTWDNISTKELMEFETKLLKNIIHPFFEIHDIKDSCGLGESCPYRIAMYEEKGSIFDRMRNKVEEYRSLNIFQLMKKKFFKSKFSLGF